MTKEENISNDNFVVSSEARGVYYISKNNKVCFFQFPIGHTVEENLSFVSKLKEDLLKTISLKNQKEKEEASKLAKEEKPEEIV